MLYWIWYSQTKMKCSECIGWELPWLQWPRTTGVKIQREKNKPKSSITLWNSLEILAFSQICFEESHGIWFWREKEVRSVGWFLRIITSKLKNASWSLHLWTRSCWHFKYKEICMSNIKILVWDMLTWSGDLQGV